MTWEPLEEQRSVEINTSGRGGSIYFRQGINTASFSWEFANSPALVLIFGTTQQHWDRQYPWASGRQEEIYNFVAAEVVRQKSAGSECEVDLASGIITVFNSSFSAKKPAKTILGNSSVSYGRRTEITDPVPPTRNILQEQLHDHLSIGIRLEAAETLHSRGEMSETALAEFLAKQIRGLYMPANGMERALSMARSHDSEVVRQALLWASYNATECAPNCAALLLDLTKSTLPPFNEEVLEMLDKLGLHNNSFDRQFAFKKLCQIAKMELDTTQSN